MSSYRKATVGLVGFGAVARQGYLPALNTLAVPVAAVVDPEPSARARAQRALPRARVYADLEDMLDHGAVEAVIIASPPSSHWRVLTRTVSSGAAVLVEKPLCLVGNAPDLHGLCSTTRIMVAHNRRYWPRYRQLVDAVRSGRVGRLRRVSLEFQAAPGGDDHRWARNEGGALHDLAPHLVDMMWLLCRNMPVSADAWSVSDGVHIEYTNPGPIKISVHVSYGSRYIERIVVEGTEGALSLTNPYGRLRQSRDASLPARGTDEARRLFAVLHGRSLLRVTLTGMLDAFFASLAGDNPFVPGWDDGVRVIHMLEQAERALNVRRASLEGARAA